MAINPSLGLTENSPLGFEAKVDELELSQEDYIKAKMPENKQSSPIAMTKQVASDSPRKGR